MARRNHRLAAARTLAMGAAIAPHLTHHAEPRQPVCIPVDWRADGASWLAYHHGWSDPRFYNVVKIASGKTHVHDGDYIATVDDFGDLVPVADVSEWGFLHSRWPVYVQGRAELH